MKNNSVNAKPLPSGLVTVRKGRRPDMLVGVLTGYRQVAQGFDVHGYAPNHYRTVEPGNFGLIVGARSAVEVQAYMDGKLFYEGVLDPLRPPELLANVNPQLYKTLLETPQPHLINQDQSGEAFVFAAPDEQADPDEIISNQIHPSYAMPTPELSGLTRAEFTLDAVARTSSLSYDGMILPMEPAPNDIPGEGCPSTDLRRDLPRHETGALRNDASEQFSIGGAGDVVSKAKEDDTFSDLKSANDGDDTSAAQELDYTRLNPSNMAPSHGFLVIGVRAIDPPSTTSEPAGPPDAFSYVGFQLNPWKLHSRAVSRLLNRMVVPSKLQLEQSMRKQGFAHEIPAERPVCACCQGTLHH